MHREPTRLWEWMVLVTICVGGCFARVLPAQQVGRAPLEVLVLEAPIVAKALGRLHLVYEFHVTNFGHDALTLDGLDVLGDDGASVATLTQMQLAQRLVPLGADGQSAAGPLQPGGRAVAYLWLTLPPTRPTPHSLRHRLRASTIDGHVDIIETAPVPVREDARSVSPPLEGGPWVAVRGPSNSSSHRLSLVTMNGRVNVPQRFAVDWVRLGDDGLFFHGDGARLQNWYGYDAPVYAVSDGTVVLVRDGAPDRRPLDVDVPATMDAAEAPGNVVVVDMGDGLYVSYAHLQSRTLRVALGNHVKAGQLVARVGNSGNSQGPHLHFQIASAIEPLAGEGRPFVLRAFTLVGRVPSVPALLSGTAWRASAAQPARQVNGELPLENMVIVFPPAFARARVP